MRMIRRSTPRARRLSVALGMVAQLAAVSLALAPRSAAQEGAPSNGLVPGVVRDDAGNEIASVEVTVEGTGIRTLTDVHGAFLLRRVPLGPASLRVRRLGFAPRTIAVTVDSVFPPAVDVTLTPLPIRLGTVQVRSTKRVYTGYMADFYRRRDTNNGGRFFTREQIDSLHPNRTSDLLRRVPGMNLTPTGGGTGTAVRMRGQRCMPLIWIDGTPAVSAYFDPDLIDPRSIAGIEIYSSLGTVPPALTGPIMAGSCGTIAIWTRIPDPKRKNAPSDEERLDTKQAATRLAALVDSLQVFTVTQVDEAVRLDTAVHFAPQFPDALRHTRRDGLVIAEFVVDVDGHIEPATLGIVSSTHPLFAAAVDSALAGAVFHPAMIAGRPVRQVVQLPVYFALPGKDGN
jgi:hypothetical protein